MHAPSRWLCLLVSSSSLTLACSDSTTGGQQSSDTNNAPDTNDTAAVETAVPDASDETAASDVSDSLDNTCVVHAECDRDAGLYCLEGQCQASADFSIGVLPAELSLMGMVGEATDELGTVGATIGELCGVVAYDNGPNPLLIHEHGPYGWHYLATELAYRFLVEHYGLSPSGAPTYGPAKTWYTAPTDPLVADLARHPSGGTEPPRPGDVIVWTVGEHGHVAVVADVAFNEAHGLVEVLEQNAPGSTHRYAITVDEGRYTVAGADGWLRVPDRPAACGVSGRFEAAAVADGALALVISAEAPDGVASLTVRAGERELASYTATGLDTEVWAPTIDLAALGLSPGAIELELLVAAVGAVPYPVARTRVVWRETPDPRGPIFDAVAAGSDVPSCLLKALAEVASGMDQSGSIEAGGIMGLSPAQLEAGAARIGVPVANLTVPTDLGAQANIKAAAALLSDLADTRIAPANRSTLESWWHIVTLFSGEPIGTSNVPYRVYAHLAALGIDLKTFPPIQGSRPATAAEIAAGIVRAGDEALMPEVPAWHVRTWEPFDLDLLAARHDCAGSCGANACQQCVPRAASRCVGDALVWHDGCGRAEDPSRDGLADDCRDDDACTLDGCAEAACTHTVQEGAVCDCAPRVGTACEDGVLRWVDSCGNAGSLADGCDDGDRCTTDGCADGACTHEVLACGEGEHCFEGLCTQSCTDRDGDGFFADCEPFDCAAADDQSSVHPGATELWDFLDNDCDGQFDELGRVRWDRWFREWTPNDWEHPWTRVEDDLGEDFVRDGRFIELYPDDVCTGAYAYGGVCVVKHGGTQIDFGDGKILVGLTQCRGRFGANGDGPHIALLLTEHANVDGKREAEWSEYSDPTKFPHFTCEHLGFAPNHIAGPLTRSKLVYRHRSFTGLPTNRQDNMWSTDPLEGDPAYNQHGFDFWAIDAY